MKDSQEFGTGILSEMTDNIYFFIKMNIYFIIGSFIPLAWLILLEPSLLSLIPLSFLGPNITALCCCIMEYVEMDKKKDDLLKSSYWSFYKKNFLDTLKFWTPGCLLFFFITVSMEYYQGNRQELGIVLFILLAISLLSVTYMVLINAKFKFRTRDLLRLSLYYACTKLKITLGVLGIFFLALIIMYFYSDFLILLLFSPFCYLLVRYTAPILRDVEENFIQSEDS